jgi:hypothetical protein
MTNIERPELPAWFRFKPVPPGDWIDMAFVLQEIEQEKRNEALAIALDTMAKVHQTVAEGAAKVANLVRSGGAQQKRG